MEDSGSEMEDSGSDDDVFDVEDEDLSRGGVPAPVKATAI